MITTCTVKRAPEVVDDDVSLHPVVTRSAVDFQHLQQPLRLKAGRPDEGIFSSPSPK